MQTRQMAGPLVLLCSILLGLVIVIFRDNLLPSHFSNDAVRIQGIAKGVQSAYNDGSYGFIGGMYRVLGLANSPILSGLMGYGALVVTLLVAFLRTRAYLGWTGIILSSSISILGAVFLGTYSKDVVVSIICLLILVRIKTRFWDILLVITMILYASHVRQYWLIMAASFIIFRLLLSRKNLRSKFLLWEIVIVVVTSLLIYVIMNVPSDYFRTEANSARMGSAEAETAIYRFVEAAEPLGGVVNNLITMAALIIPVPIAGLSVYHTFLFLAIGGMWTTFIMSAIRILSRKSSKQIEAPSVVLRAISLLLAFIAVQSLFEPDYGSALRHIVPVMPLMLVVLAHASRLKISTTRSKTYVKSD